MQNPEVRSATKKDMKVWVAMRLELWPDSNIRELTKELAGLLKRPLFHGWFAVDNGLPVGFAEVYIREFANGCESRPAAFLEGIWVKRSHRKKGIAKRLMQVIEKWVLNHGLRELGSDTLLKNCLAQICHRAWGFEETERVVYYRKKLRDR
jgi:aminoglycoside 6'-N-acetyltransferase I